MPTRLFIYPKDLMTIEQIAISTAYKRYNDLKFLFNKPKNGKITVEEYCNFNNLQIAEVRKTL